MAQHKEPRDAETLEPQQIGDCATVKHIIVVNLLKQFIEEQITLGGPFDLPEAFFDSMADFLNDKDARQLISDAWYRHRIPEVNDSAKLLTSEEVFGQLEQRAEQRLAVEMRDITRGISSDEQAIKIILKHVDDVEACMGGLEFDTFREFSNHYMQVLVQRVIEVVSHTLWVLPLRITDQLNVTDIEILKNLAGRIRCVGEPVPTNELWHVVSVVFPRLVEKLRNISGNGGSSEMTPREAAEYLNVSRGYVCKLMDDGQLPFRMVGSHRKISGPDLAAYRARQVTISRKAMTELVAISREMGLYDDTGPPPPKSAFRQSKDRDGE